MLDAGCWKAGVGVNIGYATVVENARLYANTFVTWFRAPELAHGAYPGQFLMLRCSDDAAYGALNPASSLQHPASASPPSSILHPPSSVIDADPLLPRPMSYYGVRDGGNEWAILYDVVGRGTAWLSRRKPGDRVYCWGPLGRGYEVGKGSRNLLLVAGGIGIAPLVWLADEAIVAGKNVTLIIGARSAEHVFPAQHLRPEVEVVVTTDDGSAGRKGFVTEPFGELLEWCDEAFACGPTPMFAAMAQVARKAKVRRPVQVLLEERMGCGTGICYGCAVRVHARGGQQTKLVCKDGPRFEIREIW